MSASPAPSAAPLRVGAREIYALVFGLFLGLALLKFGNPVILDRNIEPPRDLAEAMGVSWPVKWGNALLLVLGLAGLPVAFAKPSAPARRLPRALWLLPIAWFAWQAISSTTSVDARLTGVTLAHFAGCVGCFLIGLFVLGRDGWPKLLLLGVLGALALCLVKGANQHHVEFKQDRQTLIDGERTGWTNFAPEVLDQMQRDRLVLRTNGVVVANPVILLKLERARINGTLVYPNALAGALLLLLPAALTLAVFGTAELKPPIRWLVIALTTFLGFGCLYWTGSKSGWLIALGLAGGWLLHRSRWPRRRKIVAVAAIAVLGLAAFAVRFQSYFAAGATSVGARFDYWRAAAQTTMSDPVFGSGPGTFQRPYARLKAPESEMARLVHNDYLEQFSDSGVVGGALYLAWIGMVVAALAKGFARATDPLAFALALGLFGWFAQGFVEFGLYIPALAWTAFTIAGTLLAARDKAA